MEQIKVLGSTFTANIVTQYTSIASNKGSESSCRNPYNGNHNHFCGKIT